VETLNCIEIHCKVASYIDWCDALQYLPCTLTVTQLTVLLIQLKISRPSESITPTSIGRIFSNITVSTLCRNSPNIYGNWDSLRSSQNPTVSGSLPSHISFVFFLLGDSQASEFYVPTPRMRTELIKCSDTGGITRKKEYNIQNTVKV